MSHSVMNLSRAAATGAVAVGVVIALSSLGIVRADLASPDKSKHKTFKCADGTACLTAESTGTQTWGVYGESQYADGVHGVTSTIQGDSGVAGISLSKTGKGHGLYGDSTNGPGVVGISNCASSASCGKGNPYAGVYGTTNTSGAYGVYGYSTKGTGILAESNSPAYIALDALADASTTYIFDGVNAATSNECSIDYDANLSCTGTVSGSVLKREHRNSEGGRVVSYASESASQTIEDVGTGRLIDGVANVQIDPAFASVTDHKWYYVFLTPLGDTRGLYVSIKTPHAFQVRENERGRSSVEFDYRIVAHPIDGDGKRLPLVGRAR
jgi:hypothetical protein